MRNLSRQRKQRLICFERLEELLTRPLRNGTIRRTRFRADLRKLPEAFCRWQTLLHLLKIDTEAPDCLIAKIGLSATVGKLQREVEHRHALRRFRSQAL